MNKVEILMWCNTAVAVFGTYLNTKQIRFGFVLWMLTNAVFIVNNIAIKSWPQAALFSIYLGLAVLGWVSWGKRKKTQPKEN